MSRPNRHPALRLLGVPLPLLLVLVQLADGTGMHRCPAHDGTGAPVVMMSHHGGMQHAAPPTDHHQHGGPCTCLGACHGSSVALAAADGTPHLASLSTTATTGPALSDDVAARQPRLHPFANGPPTLA